MGYIVENKEVLALVILLLISEILPFSERVKSNGIFQAIVGLLKKLSKPKAEEIAKQ
jgi:hypothetical protein